MKNTIFIITLLLIYVTVNSQSNEFLDAKHCPFALGEAEAVTNAEDNFNRAKVSPDGTKVLVTKKGYRGIYIIDLENKNQVTKVSDEEKIGFRAGWVENGEAVRFESNKYDTPNKVLIYNTKNRNTNPAINNLKSTTNTANKQDEISVTFNLERRTVEATDGIKTWDVTQDAGVYYDLVISPDKNKILIHKNDGRMYVYMLDGSGLLYNLGNGLCQSWTPDNKYLIYFKSHDNGYITTDSDIYICSVDGKEKWKLTNTKDIIEVFPFLSADGSKITYYDEVTNRIYISNFLKK